MAATQGRRMLLVPPRRLGCQLHGNEVKWGQWLGTERFWKRAITGGHKKREQLRKESLGDWQSAGDVVLVQSINNSSPPGSNPPLTGLISGPPISDLTGASLPPCVIAVKGKVTFFCRLMGFFNNGEIWEQQKSPAFSFFNGAAPGRRSLLSLFILYDSGLETRWRARIGDESGM